MSENEQPHFDPTQPPAPDNSPTPAPYQQPPLPGSVSHPVPPIPSEPAAPCAPQTPTPYAGAQAPTTTPAQSPAIGQPQPTIGYGSAPSYTQQTVPQPVLSQNAPPCNQQQPYGQTPPPQPYYGVAPQPPYSAYSPHQAYATAPPHPRKKVWPWVLFGGLLVFLLGIGGCVSYTALIVNAMENQYDRSYSIGDYPSNSYPYNSYDIDPNLGYDSEVTNTFTLAEIQEAANGLQGKVVDGKCSPGVYEVGADKDIAPGLYFLEGSQTEETTYLVFSSNEDDTYDLNDAVVYFGNYYAQLEKGDVIAYTASSSLRFYEASKSTFAPKAPYQSGVYRVGIDIAAGTYSIQPQTDAAAVAEQESAAFVMKDLEFNTDSITETKYVIKGSQQTVTVKAGDYLELYAATATPAS